MKESTNNNKNMNNNKRRNYRKNNYSYIRDNIIDCKLELMNKTIEILNKDINLLSLNMDRLIKNTDKLINDNNNTAPPKKTEPSKYGPWLGPKIEKDTPSGMPSILSDLFGGINLLSLSKPNVPQKKIEKTEENDEFSEYDSDDEFEEIPYKIETLDDLIKLGDMADDLIIQDETSSESSEEPTEPENKKLGNLDLGCEISFVLLDENGNQKIEKIDRPSKKEKKEKPITNTSYCTLNGKKYSINLIVLNKLRGPLIKLKNMIGLDSVKNKIVDMVLYYMQHFEKRNENMLHTVIEGPPGVGKTELGKIFAEIYAGMGIIRSSAVKIVKRTDLIGEYLGHTAKKTQKAIDDAEGGVLFIDEAYSLGNEDKKDTYAKECIDTLNLNLSENKKKFICIIAGYPDELDKCFFSFNPGLRRRFPFRYAIDGYNYMELCNIFLKKLKDSTWTINEVDLDNTRIINFFKNNMHHFSNFGGDIENLLIQCKFMHSRRVAGKHPKHKRKLTFADISKGLESFTNFKKSNNNNYHMMYC